MLIENTKLLNYTKDKEKLILIVEGTPEVIKSELNNKSELTLYTDNLEKKYAVETFFGYSTMVSMKEDMLTGSYEVVLVNDNNVTGKLIVQEGQLAEQLKRVELLEDENSLILLDSALKDMEIAELKEEILGSKEEIVNLNEELSKSNSNLTELQEGLKEESDKILDLSEHLGDNLDNMSLLEEDFSELLLESAMKDIKISELEESLENKNLRLDSLESDIADLMMEIAMMRNI